MKLDSDAGVIAQWSTEPEIRRLEGMESVIGRGVKYVTKCTAHDIATI